jgi:hypothetical protein
VTFAQLFSRTFILTGTLCGTGDPVMFKRMADIESLPEKDKQCLLLTVDNFIKATKLNSL